MENLEEMLVPVELKYCERCGGLWFRSKNQEEEVYCPGWCRRWRSSRLAAAQAGHRSASGLGR